MSVPQFGDPRGWDAYYSWDLKAYTRMAGVRITGSVGVTIVRTVPVDAGSATMANNTGGVYFNHPATIAAYTFTMPALPEDQQEVTIASRSEITALTHSAGAGKTLRGGLTTLLADGFAKYQYDTATTTWVRIG